MLYTYRKRSVTEVAASTANAVDSLAAALAELGFSPPPRMGGGTRHWIALKPSGLPGYPFLYEWQIVVEPRGKTRALVTIDYGSRATPGTWIYFAVALVVMIVPILLEAALAIPYAGMAACLVLFWLFAAMLAVKFQHRALETRLWRKLRSAGGVGDTTYDWMAIE